MKLPKITSTPLWLVLPAMLTLVYTCTRAAYPLDFWHQVATGHLIWQQGEVPAYDTFSYAIGGQPVVNQNWLAQLAMYLLYRWGGFPLAQFVAGLCYAAAILIITRLAWHRSADVSIACGLGMVAMAMALSNLTVRPQALSALLFAAELFALYQWPGRWRTVGVVAGAELLWTNTHGAFPLGIVLPGVFLVANVWVAIQRSAGDWSIFRREGLLSGKDVGRKHGPVPFRAGAGSAGDWSIFRREGLPYGDDVGRKHGPVPFRVLRQVLSDRVVHVDLAAVLAGLAAMFCNPHPGKTLDYVFGVVSRAPQRRIDEWLPTSTGDHAAIAYAASIALVLVVLGLSRKRLQPVDLLLLVSFAVLGNRAQRMILWWGLVLAAVLAPQAAAVLRSWRKARAVEHVSNVPGTLTVEHVSNVPGTLETCPTMLPERSISNFATLLVLVAFTAMCTPWTRQYNPLLPPSKRQAYADDEPRQVVRYLQTVGYRGRVFCPMEWSAYFDWFLRPDVTTLVDARIDFFPDEVWTEYVEVGRGGRRWPEILQKYDVDLVVWDRRWTAALPKELGESAGWKKVFEDPLSVAFRRVDLAQGR